MCIAMGSIRGLYMSNGVIGSSYVMVSATKWAIICVSQNEFTYEYTPNDWWLCPKKEPGNQTNIFYHFMEKAQNHFEVSLGCRFQDKIMDQAWNKWRPHITHYLM
jgi:hypothetical protein